jgi:hypothetical protein
LEIAPVITTKNTCALVVAFWLGGCVCSDDLPSIKKDVGSKVADSKPTSSDSRIDFPSPDKSNALKDKGPTEGKVDTTFTLDITCPDGSKPDLTSMPNCDKLISQLLDQCCPKPNQGLNSGLSGMVCVKDADGFCKMTLDSATMFQLTCDQMKTSKDCT